jgi:hypothetical protein
MTSYETIEKIRRLQDSHGCWNVEHDNKYGPKLTYYVPNYKSTLWTLVLLADIEADRDDSSWKKPLKIITEHFWDEEYGIFTIGKSHFPIPCLNGNMIYLLQYFNMNEKNRVDRVVDFFSQYQRFDDGDFKTPYTFPYHNNKSCYGKHTCFWGVVKLLKGFSFIPEQERSEKLLSCIQECIEYILLHEVCYSSHNPDQLLHPMIGRLTLPNMYKADFLEILWILSKEGVWDDNMSKALKLLNSKMKPDGTWELERQVKDLIVPVTKKSLGNELITKRARKVLTE